MCGEKACTSLLMGWMLGSPPHVRGKGRVRSCRALLLRITPACAGKRFRWRYWFHTYQDHPRMCGEKISMEILVPYISGSPPHVRGKDAVKRHSARGFGITPAYAGKRCPGPARPPATRDHPRVCGEKLKGKITINLTEGSPPRMRGKGHRAARRRRQRGITPAYAGKRLKRSRSTVPPVAIVPLFPSVCNKPVASDGSPAGRDAPLFLPAENAVPASPAYNLRSL